MHDLESLSQELQAIKARNHRVELEKAREISMARKFWISLITFIVISVYLYLIGETTWLFDALGATLGYIIGARGVGWAKKIWMKNYK